MVVKDPQNVRRHSRKNKQAIKTSLETVGPGRSILLDGDDIIRAGNGVFDQAQVLKIPIRIVESDGTELIAVKRTDLHGQQALRAAVLDNLAADSGANNYDGKLLKKLLANDELLAAQARENVQLKHLLRLKTPREPNDPDEVLSRADQLQAKWEVQAGDLWQIGRHRLLCGDSTDEKAVARLFSGQSWAVMFTDPPYGIAYDTTSTGRSKRDLGAVANDALSDAALLQLNTRFLQVALQYAVDDQVFYICASGNKVALLQQAAKDLDLHLATSLVWVKNKFAVTWERYHPQHEWIVYGGEGAKPTGPNSRWFGPQNETTVWQIAVNASAKYQHPTQKPVGLPARALINSSQPDELVYDPFCGSGTTLVAAEQTGRCGFGVELEPKYVAVTLERLEAFGLTPERIP